MDKDKNPLWDGPTTVIPNIIIYIIGGSFFTHGMWQIFTGQDSFIAVLVGAVGAPLLMWGLWRLERRKQGPRDVK